MPIVGHNSRYLANIQRAYDSHTRLQQNENKTTALGAIGTIGFAILMVVAVFPIGQTSILRPLGVLTAACVLIGIAGGIGSLFAFFVSPQIRAYNRIAIYIAFFSLAASCGLVDRLIRGRGSNFRIPVFVLIVAFGLWDQTGNGWFRSKIANDRYVVATESRTDAEFFSSWEQTNANGTVFCLPFIAFPETNHSGTLSGYDHARGYLHTKTARWSYGAMKGREDDLWQREVVLRPALQLLDAIIFRGFDTIFIDLRGYEGNVGVEKQKELMASLGVDCPVRIHPDGKQFLYDLRPYCERRRRELGAEYDRLAKRENDDVRFLWLDGFVSFQNVGEEWKHRLCQTSGILVVVNPSNETRTLVVDAIFRTDLASDSQLEIDGEIWRESLTISRNTQPSQRTLTIPPGRNHVSFRCKLSREYVPYDSRRLAFFVALFRTS